MTHLVETSLETVSCLRGNLWNDFFLGTSFRIAFFTEFFYQQEGMKTLEGEDPRLKYRPHVLVFLIICFINLQGLKFEEKRFASY